MNGRLVPGGFNFAQASICGSSLPAHGGCPLAFEAGVDDIDRQQHAPTMSGINLVRRVPQHSKNQDNTEAIPNIMKRHFTKLMLRLAHDRFMSGSIEN
jgi:hypothetical protein